MKADLAAGFHAMLKLLEWFTRGRTDRDDSSDSLNAFGSEREVIPRLKTSSSWNRGPQSLKVPLAIGILISTLAVSGYLVIKWRPFQLEAASASLTIESDPAGAEVYSAGVKRGATPLTMAVAPGEHTFELVSGERRKALRATARAGASVVHHVEFDAAPPPAPTKASLSVVTEPAKLRVLFDGKPLGVSPLIATDLEPGAHKVQIVGSSGTLERRVDLYAGETASVIITAAISAAPKGPEAGWLTVTSPVPLQIVEAGNVIGSTQSSKLLVPVGKHDLQLVNESLGISDRRTVQVSAGGTSQIKIDVPKAPLSINALPWAEVFVDGRRIGETPIGNLPVSVGTREVMFRHPEFGERRQTVTVSLKAPARVSVDMRKPQ